MKKQILLCVVLSLSSSVVWATDDVRQMVKMPEMMQAHMLASMRGHLETINLILLQLSKGELDKAADTAEQRLGMSSLETHDAKHLAQFMPDGMQAAGTQMHHAASRFALRAQEGDVLPAYAALQEVTAACTTCHAGYRIR